MRDMITFSANVLNCFENNYDNMLAFNELVMDAGRGVYNKYSKEETNKILRNQFDRILGIDFANATPMKRRQAWRAHGLEICSLIEDVIVDRMNSGWTEANARFMELVEERNLALGDTNEFYVEDNSLLQVSEYAGNHHDVIRQSVKPGKAFTIETSHYVIKVYTDYELFRLGKVDFAGLVDKMYRSIEKQRYDAVYTAFMSMDKSLPADMIDEIEFVPENRELIIAHAELVASVTGKPVMFVGARSAIAKLQSTVTYDMWSGNMKDERNQNGILAKWEGYDCLALNRVNKTGTRTELAGLTNKIMVVPVDPDFKPIKRVNEGDVQYWESGMDGMKKDMTVDAEISYIEGIGIVMDALYGVIKIAE